MRQKFVCGPLIVMIIQQTKYSLRSVDFEPSSGHHHEDKKRGACGAYYWAESGTRAMRELLVTVLLTKTRGASTVCPGLVQVFSHVPELIIN
jgi:hypothetical protein